MPLSPRSPIPVPTHETVAAKDKLVAAITDSMAHPPEHIGAAVSGGSDSLALLLGLKAAFCNRGVKISVATANHGLRSDAAAEADAVAQFASELGFEHSVLTWDHVRRIGNLQGQARDARFNLLSHWAQQRKIPIVALGHTADDQAETVLMRMRREAGVNGLAGIPERRTVGGVEFRRPLLSLRRQELREVLRAEGIGWIDDPSNENDQFERVRTRKALAVLESIGVSPTVFASVAENLTQARKALEWYSFLAAREVLDVHFGAVVISRRAFRVLPVEIAHRLLAASIQWLTGGEYVPRRRAMVDAREVVKLGGGHTVAGCRILIKDEQAWLFRELNALRNCAVPLGQPWDARWLVYGGVADNYQVRALADEGLRECPNWRDLGCPREVLQATPAIWNEDELIAAPVAGFGNGWNAALTRSEEALYTSFLTH